MIEALRLPAELDAGDYRLRRAALSDLSALIGLVTADPIAATRGDSQADEAVEAYRAALVAVAADPSNEVVVAVDANETVAATMQLTRIPGLARRGATRLLVEAVRVGVAYRSEGLGAAMMRWAMSSAADATGSSIVQLTSDERRLDAHRFYERLGFVASHRGFKYDVP